METVISWIKGLFMEEAISPVGKEPDPYAHMTDGELYNLVLDQLHPLSLGTVWFEHSGKLGIYDANDNKIK